LRGGGFGGSGAPIELIHALIDRFRATGHPIIEGYDPPEGWGWCYIDEVFFDLGDDVTPQRGPIPRFVR